MGIRPGVAQMPHNLLDHHSHFSGRSEEYASLWIIALQHSVENLIVLRKSVHDIQNMCDQISVYEKVFKFGHNVDDQPSPPRLAG